MFRFYGARLALGAFSVFMKENRYHPKLKGLGAGPRAKVLSQMYKELSPEEKQLLLERAAKVPFVFKKPRPPKEEKPEKTPKRPPSEYMLFVKENLHKFDSLPKGERMKAVARLWNIEKNAKL